MKKPEVYIFAILPDHVILSEILAGAEEEGIRLTVQMFSETTTANALSQKAAMSCTFGVGIGLVNDEAALSIRTGNPLFSLQGQETACYRLLGHNIGRYIKREPFL